MSGYGEGGYGSSGYGGVSDGTRRIDFAYPGELAKNIPMFRNMLNNLADNVYDKSWSVDAYQLTPVYITVRGVPGDVVSFERNTTSNFDRWEPSQVRLTEDGDATRAAHPTEYDIVTVDGSPVQPAGYPGLAVTDFAGLLDIDVDGEIITYYSGTDFQIEYLSGPGYWVVRWMVSGSYLGAHPPAGTVYVVPFTFKVSTVLIPSSGGITVGWELDPARNIIRYLYKTLGGGVQPYVSNRLEIKAFNYYLWLKAYAILWQQEWDETVLTKSDAFVGWPKEHFLMVRRGDTDTDPIQLIQRYDVASWVMQIEYNGTVFVNPTNWIIVTVDGLPAVQWVTPASIPEGAVYRVTFNGAPVGADEARIEALKENWTPFLGIEFPSWIVDRDQSRRFISMLLDAYIAASTEEGMRMGVTSFSDKIPDPTFYPDWTFRRGWWLGHDYLPPGGEIRPDLYRYFVEEIRRSPGGTIINNTPFSTLNVVEVDLRMLFRNDTDASSLPENLRNYLRVPLDPNGTAREFRVYRELWSDSRPMTDPLTYHLVGGVQFSEEDYRKLTRRWLQLRDLRNPDGAGRHRFNRVGKVLSDTDINATVRWDDGTIETVLKSAAADFFITAVDPHFIFFDDGKRHQTKWTISKGAIGGTDLIVPDGMYIGEIGSFSFPHKLSIEGHVYTENVNFVYLQTPAGWVINWAEAYGKEDHSFVRKTPGFDTVGVFPLHCNLEISDLPTTIRYTGSDSFTYTYTKGVDFDYAFGNYPAGMRTLIVAWFPAGRKPPVGTTYEIFYHGIEPLPGVQYTVDLNNYQVYDMHPSPSGTLPQVTGVEQAHSILVRHGTSRIMLFTILIDLAEIAQQTVGTNDLTLTADDLYELKFAIMQVLNYTKLATAGMRVVFIQPTGRNITGHFEGEEYGRTSSINFFDFPTAQFFHQLRSQNVIMSSAFRPWQVHDILLNRYGYPLAWQQEGSRTRVKVRWEGTLMANYRWFYLDEFNHLDDTTDPLYGFAFGQTPWYELAWPQTAYARSVSQLDLPLSRAIPMAFSVIGGDEFSIVDYYHQNDIPFAAEMTITHGLGLSLYGKYPKIPVVQIWNSLTKRQVNPYKVLLMFDDGSENYTCNRVKLIFDMLAGVPPSRVSIRIGGGDTQYLDASKKRMVRTRLLTNPVSLGGGFFRYVFEHGLTTTDGGATPELFPLYQLIGLDYELIWPYTVEASSGVYTYVLSYDKPVRAVAVA